MEGFKYGDIVMIEGMIVEGLVVDHGHDSYSDGDWVSVLPPDCAVPFTFTQDSILFNTSQLTIVSRHQKWISLVDEYP